MGTFLSFDEFKNIFLDEFERSLEEIRPGIRETHHLKTQTIEKPNRTLTGFNMEPNDSSGTRVSPTLYVEDAYRDFLNNDYNVYTVAAEAARTYDTALRNMPEFTRTPEDLLKDKPITGMLVNISANRDLINSCPHRKYGDLALLYRVQVSADENGIASAVITNDVADFLQKSEIELFDMAQSHYSVEKGTAIVANLCELIGMPEMSDSFPAYVITTPSHVYGAAAIISKDVMNTVAEKIGSDNFVLLPSSLEEFIAMPVPNTSSEIQRLSSMQRNVQREVVDPKDHLSDCIYLCKADKGEIERIFDGPDLNRDK